MLLGPALFGSSAGWTLGHQVGAGVGVVSELGVLRAALPLIGGVLLALPMQPPIEHGLRRLLEHRFRQKTIGTAQMPAYTRIKEAGSDGVLRMTSKRECRAIWRLPTTNLRLAHALQKQTGTEPLVVSIDLGVIDTPLAPMLRAARPWVAKVTPPGRLPAEPRSSGDGTNCFRTPN
jgi:hypothetical protein